MIMVFHNKMNIKKYRLYCETAAMIKLGGMRSMAVFDLIKNRRSIGVVSEKEVPDAIIHQLLDAAIWAPTHRHTEPWQFRVVKGDARKKLGEAMAEIIGKKSVGLDEAEAKKKIEKMRKGPLRAPVIIVVACRPTGIVPEIEEIVACGCALQNILLMAAELGLAAMVRTGEIAFEKELNQYLQLAEEDKIIGFVYLGYAKKDLKVKGVRTPAEEKTVWFT